MHRTLRLISAVLAGALASLPPTFGVEVAVAAALATPLFLMATRGDGAAAPATGARRGPDRLKTRGETLEPACQRIPGTQGTRGIVGQPLQGDRAGCRVAQLYV